MIANGIREWWSNALEPTLVGSMARQEILLTFIAFCAAVWLLGDLFSGYRKGWCRVHDLNKEREKKGT